MNIKKMKKLYKTGDWILLTPSGITSEWMIVESPRWDCDNYKLVHKKHKHILDAYLDGCRIYWKDLVQNTYEINEKFIEYYDDIWADDSWDYEAVPKSLENCYCEANELHYDKLCETHIQDSKLCSVKFNNFYILDDNQFGANNFVFHKAEKKKIQFNEHLNEWVYCIYEEKTNERYIMGNNDNNNVSDRLADSKTILNNFEDYGFTANFKGKILNEINGILFGIVEDKNIAWTKYNGHRISDGTVWDNTDLTPIKKEWYDDLNNFPALVVEENGSLFNHYIVYDKNSFLDLQDGCFVRLATKKELNEIYCDKNGR